jgi:tRNA dimethylallyltransferase
LNSPPWPLIILLGPTGAGKSELGLVLAEAFAGEIINCDSIQVYRGLQIGCAKVPLAERRGIRHHLIDIIDLDEDLTAGSYSRLAREVISSIQVAGRLPIVVGGTGFYLRALFEGLSPAPVRDVNLRSRLAGLARRRPSALHRFLSKHDAEAAARIHPNDRQKLIRAIEMTWVAGQPATIVQNRPRDSMPGVHTLKIGLNPNRSALYRRLDERSNWMFQNGLLAEAQAALDSGLSPEVKPLGSLGYKQAVKFLTAQVSIEKAIQECQTKTRQYAKRQLTWFRKEREVHWLHEFGTEEGVQQAALELTRAFLKSFDNLQA